MNSPASGQRARNGRSESKYLLLTLIPPLLVIALIAYGIYRDASITGDVEAELDRLSKANVMQDLHEVTVSFDNRLDHTHSKSWSDVLQATVWLDYIAEEIESPLLYGGTGKNDGDWNSIDLQRRWKESAAPVLKMVHSMVEEAQANSDPAWQPFIFSEGTPLHAVSNSRKIMKLLETEFRVAAADGDSAKAMKSLRAMSGVIRAFDWQIGIGCETHHQIQRRFQRVIINESLAMDLWKTNQQLEQLRDMLADTHSTENRWQTTWNQTYAYTLSNWETPASFLTAMHAEHAILPGVKNAALESLRTCSQATVTNEQGVTSRVGTAAYAQAVYQRQQADSQRPIHIAQPSVVAIPYANQDKNHADLDNATRLASQLALDQIQRRWTLTAIAVKQFKIKENRWPRKLSELESVGHSAADSIAVGNSRFKIRQLDDEVTVWTAKIRSEFGFLLKEDPDFEAEIRVR